MALEICSDILVTTLWLPPLVNCHQIPSLISPWAFSHGSLALCSVLNPWGVLWKMPLGINLEWNGYYFLSCPTLKNHGRVLASLQGCEQSFHIICLAVSVVIHEDAGPILTLYHNQNWKNKNSFCYTYRLLWLFHHIQDLDISQQIFVVLSNCQNYDKIIQFLELHLIQFLTCDTGWKIKWQK